MDKEQAFQALRNSFAASLQLAHPREDWPYEIHTDTSKVGISAVLSQRNELGEVFIISTASRVLTEIERRYSVCEQELLAIVYAVKKFRIYIMCYPVTVYSDNKALSFLRKCTLTSDRVTRWVMQLQEYNLQIKHISGAQNFFADILSRNPVGLTPEIREFQRKKQDIQVAKIDLGISEGVVKQLNNLPKLQQGDPTLQKVIKNIQQEPDKWCGRYSFQQGILCSKDRRNYSYWRIMLPQELEIPIIKYVHESLGHQGTDKCFYQISVMFCLRNLGRKLRKYIASCDTC
jgi:hypothetical protein